MAKATSESSAYRSILLLSVGVIGVVAAIFFAATTWLRQAPEEIPFDPLAAHTEWQTEIQDVASEVDQGASSDRLRALREELLMLRVTSEDRDFHLQFILALLALERGDANAQALFIQARTAALQ